MAKVNDTHLLIFCEQFASMIRSSLQLVDVLDNLARETPQKRLKAVIQEVSAEVQQGIDLGDAMAKRPEAFDDVFVNVVRAGMASGQLGAALTQMVTYMKVLNEMGRKTRSAMTYPIFMIVAFFVVFNGQVLFILPRFGKMFESFGKKLPWATQFLLDVGNFWMAYWWLICGTIALVTFAFVAWKKTPEGRDIWDEYKLKIPLMGGIWRMGALARFLRTLAVQVHNDVRLLDALRLAGDAASNVYIRKTIRNIANDVENGVGLSRAFANHKIFHGIILQMIAAGEEAGALDELLLSSAEYFDALLADRLGAVTGLINPIMTVFVGAAIAGMMVASFLPVFQIGSAV